MAVQWSTARCCLYSLLYLTGYDAIAGWNRSRPFASWARIARCIPVRTVAVSSATTGPLCRDRNALGMAIAEAYLAAKFGSGSSTTIRMRSSAIAVCRKGIAQEMISLGGLSATRQADSLLDDKPYYRRRQQSLFDH
ncbi:hypothetical protein ACFFYR_36795 [Paraburkholderia dipogonis]|uniref:hypothetical protein n=1 Tax=Paraburkholderia dipogonis TaxID=1211383 RepID=UPI0035EB2D17